MNTERTDGFYAGVSYTRKAVIDFLLSHMDAGATLTMDEIIKEIDRWENQDAKSGLRDLDTGFKVVLIDSKGQINEPGL